MTTTRKSNEARDLDELTRSVEDLENDLRAMHRSGGPSVQEVQRFASRLTDLQLLLNDLQRVAAAQPGDGGNRNDRFAELEARIRQLRGALYDEMRQGGRAMN